MPVIIEKFVKLMFYVDFVFCGKEKANLDIIGLKIIELITEYRNQAYVLITVGCVIIGTTFALSEDGTEKIKKRLPFIVCGWLIVSGAITLGARYGASLQF